MTRLIEKGLAVAACMVASAWLVSSHSGRLFPFDALLAALAAFSAWLALELRVVGSGKVGSSLHPHDLKLGLSLRDLFDEDVLRFLRREGFGTPFQSNRLDHLQVVADDWVGTEWEFEDERLDNISSEMVRLSGELCNKIAEYAGPAARWPDGFISVPLDSERAADQFSQRTHDNILELQQLSRDLVAQYEAFEKLFRRLAPEAYDVEPNWVPVAR